MFFRFSAHNFNSHIISGNRNRPQSLMHHDILVSPQAPIDPILGTTQLYNAEPTPELLSTNASEDMVYRRLRSLMFHARRNHLLTGSGGARVVSCAGGLRPQLVLLSAPRLLRGSASA